MRRIVQLSMVLLGVAVIVLAWGWSNARADPVVRFARVEMANWPVNAPPLRVVLTSDIHSGNVVTGHVRLGRIVDRINA